MRKVELSISGVIKAKTQYSNEFFKAYLFTHTLRSQVKHPIILNYKQQLTLIRKHIGYSDYKFRRELNNALRQGLITQEGNHLRLWSKNKDRAFKSSKRNDYRTTTNPQEFIKIVLFEYHYKKQYHAIKVQTHKSVKNSEPKANFNISCSAKAITNLFGYKSTSSGYRLINYIAQKHITLKKNKVDISKQQFRDYLKQGKTNIRYSNNSYYMVLASTFTMKSTTKRTKYEPYTYLSDEERVTYLNMGYTIEQINKLKA